MIKIKLPLTDDIVNKLKIGQKVLISGTLYTARDAAHKRLYETLIKGEKPPFDLSGQVIYYVGPTTAKPGQIIGSAGPTTSSRMDPYTPWLLANGLKGMIGKGQRSEEVIEAIKKYRAVYFASLGGAGALLSKCIKKAKIIAYADLGPEAIYQLEVEDFPAWVSIDTQGNNLYREARKEYKK